MLRKISLITALLSFVVCANGQGLNFGVHVDPLLSFMGSSEPRDVVPSGTNLGLVFGVEGEYYFNDGQNYALTFGGNFALNKGGRLRYENGGVLLPRTDLDGDVYFSTLTDTAGNAIGTSTATQQNIPSDSIRLAGNTSVRYNINYLELPFGLKLRTNELGGSYMRAFFHIPVATIGIPVSARAVVDAPQPEDASNTNFYTEEEGGISGENVYSEIVPIQFSLGVGAGVEYAPNEDGGLRIVGGVYYNYGFLDTVKRNSTFTSTGTLEDNTARSGLHNVALRIGIVF